MKPGECYLDHDYSILLIEVIEFYGRGQFHCKVLFVEDPSTTREGDIVQRYYDDPALEPVECFKLEDKWVILRL